MHIVSAVLYFVVSDILRMTFYYSCGVEAIISDFPGTSETTLKTIDEYIIWIQSCIWYNDKITMQNTTGPWFNIKISPCQFRNSQDGRKIHNGIFSYTGKMTCIYIESDSSTFHEEYRLMVLLNYDDVIRWEHFPRYWHFVQSLVNSPHKGQWRGGGWCFLWSAPEPTVEQTMETLVIWDATVLIMTSL